MKRLVYGVMMVLGLTAVQAFAKGYDLNDDGKVTKEEFCARQAVIYKQRGEELPQGLAEKRFETRDANKDGVLVGDELK